jgi:hypothetical protein
MPLVLGGATHGKLRFIQVREAVASDLNLMHMHCGKRRLVSVYSKRAPATGRIENAIRRFRCV